MVNTRYYNNFEDWFYELDQYNIRAERFFEYLDALKFEGNSDANAMSWLRAAFNAGRGIIDDQL